MTESELQGRDGERLQKVLARLGFGSRRVCEDLISEGRVSINGIVAILGSRVDASEDVVEVDGVRLGVQPDFVTYLLNKPRGVVSSASDNLGRETVVDLVPNDPRVFPVGRLDIDTEGLILLTNDGTLAHHIMHPSFGLKKEYLVKVSNSISKSAISSLRKGIELEDGLTAPAEVGVLGEQLLRIAIHEGRNRQIRRMIEAIGMQVERLVRVRIGPISDTTLEPGKYRQLSNKEIRLLSLEVFK
ncbi:MAG: rRNA pseudouridine synthase [Acidimicrobiales bacterium]|nr:rRNA pseudouridine synthase [Acidimicrobiales bacterium]